MSQCRISYDSKGVATVVNEEGKPSKLYKKILDLVGDQDASINAWSAAVDPESGLNGEETTITSLMNFMDSTVSISSKLTPEETLNIRNIMSENGFESMSDFNSVMIGLFKPNGYIELPERDNTGRNLYTQEDLEILNIDEVSGLMSKMQGHLLKGEDIYAQVQEQSDMYFDSSIRNELGMSKKISNRDVMQYLTQNINDFSDNNEIEFAIKNSPFTQLIERFEKGGKFKKDLLEQLQDLRRVPTLTMVAGELTDANTTYYTTVKNTLLNNLSTTEIEADMEYVASIDDYIWRTSPELVEDVVKGIEQSLTKSNIDIIGLSNHIGSKEVVLDILNEVYLMMKQPNHRNILAFTEKFEQLVPAPMNSKVRLVDERYEGLNIVNVESTLTDAELYNNNGLIKVGEDTYHKVDQEADLNTVIDFLARRLMEGEYQIPSEFMTANDMTDKVTILENINTYLASKKEIKGLKNKLLYTAYKEVFGHQDILPKIQDTTEILNIRTDSEYLKSGFITDFYNYILQEKAKNSALYNTTLSHFIINDKDISLRGQPITIEGLKYQQELEDYIRIKRGSNMRYLLTDTFAQPILEDLVALNFPETVQEIDGEFSTNGNHIVRDNTSENYVKLQGTLYRKSGSNNTSDIYTAIFTQPNPTYYTDNLNFEVDSKGVMAVLDNNKNIFKNTENIEEAKPLNKQSDQSTELSPKKPMFGQRKSIGDYSIILDTQLNIVTLYNESNRQEIIDKIDECGG